jgi:hypothetical protein
LGAKRSTVAGADPSRRGEDRRGARAEDVADPDTDIRRNVAVRLERRERVARPVERPNEAVAARSCADRDLRVSVAFEIADGGIDAAGEERVERDDRLEEGAGEGEDPYLRRTAGT